MKLRKRLLRRYLPDPVRRLLPLRSRLVLRPDHCRVPILIAADKRVAYTVVPKAANSTIRRFLWAASGETVSSEDAARRLYERGAGPLRRARNYSSADLRAILQGDGWFRFTFVRNPYARLRSAYANKITLGWARGSLLYARKIDPTAAGPMPFARFVESVCAQADAGMDIHWQPQSNLIMSDLIRYDHIGRIESFDADMLPVAERLKLPENLVARFELEPINRTPAETAGPFAPIFTPDLAEMVYHRYREDFERFGYDRDSWRQPGPVGQMTAAGSS